MAAVLGPFGSVAAVAADENAGMASMSSTRTWMTVRCWSAERSARCSPSSR
jgi:hypothetical protein